LRCGDLNKNLIFQAPTKVSDGMGGTVSSWLTVFTCKGAYWPLSGAEAVAAMSLAGTITGKVRIRFRPKKIAVTWRILVDNLVLSIASPPIKLGGRNEWMEIKVKEAA
jgi:SPP1 family predicted phage head-tail adaptor